MPSIEKLPDQVVNQIAAGEVVERPAAVVKELVENALDAEASMIEVAFEKGGKQSIRIQDNGFGMSPAEARLALERHATSKIRSVQDVEKVISFGFRGEALPSIASVCRFRLRSRPADREEGHFLSVEGGRLEKDESCGMPPGTRIEANELFFNVPARRKFLKTDRTESAHITQLCRLLAIANPSVGFALTEDGREVFRSPPCKDRPTRIREILGRVKSESFMSLDYEDKGIRLSGLVGKPGHGRATRGELFSYVNRRPVESRTLHYALMESYATYLPRGRFPIAYLFVELDPERVDINVHPTKREVRFREPGTVRQVVMEGLIDCLRACGRPALEHARRVEPIPADSIPSASQVPPRALPENLPAPAAPPQPVGQTAPPPSGKPAHREATAAETPLPWLYQGQLGGQYAMFESDDGLVVLHLRAARARILYERIQKQLEQDRSASQPLLFPEIIEWEPVDFATWEENADPINQLGFDLEAFGRNVVRLRAHPDWIDGEEAKGFVQDMIHRLREQGLRPAESQDWRQGIARLAATRQSLEKTELTRHEAEKIATQLLQCDNPLSDPKGRPTFRETGWRQLERQFGN